MPSPTLSINLSFRSTLAFAPVHSIFPRRARSPRLSAGPLADKSRVLTLLRTLFLSLRSFSRPHRLFSTACGLFCKNTRVGGISASLRALCVSALSFAHRFFTLVFSYSYELLFPEALYFHNHPHCPGVSPQCSRASEKKLLSDADHEGQFLIAVMGGNSPAAERRQVYAREHEGLVWVLPTSIGLIAREWRCAPVQAPARYGKGRARFGMCIEAGAPEKKFLAEGRVIRSVMRQATPDAIRA